MAKVPRQEREATAERRLISILKTQGVATARTLEQKIADAGPSTMRVQPHILTPVRRKLVAQGRLVRLSYGRAQWFHLAEEDRERVAARLAELVPIWSEFTSRNVTDRTGEALEIATFLALVAAVEATPINGFHDLMAPNARGRYAKQEQHAFNGRSLGAESLDFIVETRGQYCGIEVKNIREWMYPDRKEIKDAIRKALTLGVVPVVIARRVPYVTFRVLNPCGIIIHQTYNQLLSEWDREIAAKASDKNLLGYHDLRVGHTPDPRMAHFVTDNLPSLVPQAIPKLEANLAALEEFANNRIDFDDFFARTDGGHPSERDWLDEI